MGERDPSLTAMCLDSPFSSLRQLCLELAETSWVPLLPYMLALAVFGSVRERVQELACFDIDDIVPLKYVEKSQVPALFIHAKDDSRVPMRHSVELFEAYAGEKD